MIFRRVKTLKNSLAPSIFNKNSGRKQPMTKPTVLNPGSHKCRHERCKSCHSIHNNVTVIKSNDTGEKFQLKTHMDCSSTFVIYMLECCNILAEPYKRSEHV